MAGKQCLCQPREGLGGQRNATRAGPDRFWPSLPACVEGLGARKLCDRVRCAWRNDQQVGCFSKTDMQDVCFVTPQILFGISATTCNRLKGEWCNEFLSRASYEYVYLCARLCKFGSNISRFITCDGTRHAEQNVFTREYGHMRRLYFQR